MVMSYPPGERGTSGKMKRHAPGLTARLEVGTGAGRLVLETDPTWKWRTDEAIQSA
jgi:hypothetical protein